MSTKAEKRLVARTAASWEGAVNAGVLPPGRRMATGAGPGGACLEWRRGWTQYLERRRSRGRQTLKEAPLDECAPPSARPRLLRAPVYPVTSSIGSPAGTCFMATELMQ